MKITGLVKKIALAMALAVIFTTVPNVDAYAAPYRLYSAEKHISSGFSRAWSARTELYPVDEVDDWGVMITYGYDTWWTKEDYVKKVGGQPAGCEAYGYVVNSEGTWNFTNVVGDAKLTGKADVKHTGNSVYYGVKLRVYY